MNYKVTGIIIIILGSLVIFSTGKNSWIISAIMIGLGSGLLFWREKK